MSSDIVVVGSLNQDLTIRVPRLPQPGETILGTDHFTGAGGKGANQAAAAARLGGDVAMVGRVGEDAAGRILLSALDAEGVDASFVRIDRLERTGMAVITLDEAGENAIVVSPGANGRLTAADVLVASDRLDSAAVTLVQLEIPVAAVEAAVERAGGVVVLNPAPARPLPEAMLRDVDVLVPNRSELAVLSGGHPARSIDEAASQAASLVTGGAVVVTLGAEGALLVRDEGVEHVPAPDIDPVDATAAGDGFCGALAEVLARGEDIIGAVRRAVHAGAVAATRPGAMSSLPTAAEVSGLIASSR